MLIYMLLRQSLWIVFLGSLALATAADAALTISADNVIGFTGGTVDVSIRVTEFNNIQYAQGTLTFSSPAVSFNSTLGYGLPGMTAANFGTAQSGNDVLTFAWNAPTLDGVSVPDGTTIFKIRLNVFPFGGPNVPVNFTNSPVALSFLDSNSASVPFNTVPGSVTLVIADGCSIVSFFAGTQTACVPASNTYTQQLTVSTAFGPGTGNLIVNGQAFPASSGGPQVVTLIDLPANGLPVSVTASYSAVPSCTRTANNVFTAPTFCDGMLANGFE